MDRRVTHPTKEQIRAYMLAREHAYRPPPPPEEIRRQLNWHCVDSGTDWVLGPLCLLPAALGQLIFQSALECCLTPLLASVGLQQPTRKH